MFLALASKYERIPLFQKMYPCCFVGWSFSNPRHREYLIGLVQWNASSRRNVSHHFQTWSLSSHMSNHITVWQVWLEYLDFVSTGTVKSDPIGPRSATLLEVREFMMYRTHILTILRKSVFRIYMFFLHTEYIQIYTVWWTLPLILKSALISFIRIHRRF